MQKRFAITLATICSAADRAMYLFVITLDLSVYIAKAQVIRNRAVPCRFLDLPGFIERPFSLVSGEPRSGLALFFWLGCDAEKGAGLVGLDEKRCGHPIPVGGAGLLAHACRVPRTRRSHGTHFRARPALHPTPRKGCARPVETSVPLTRC